MCDLGLMTNTYTQNGLTPPAFFHHSLAPVMVLLAASVALLLFLRNREAVQFRAYIYYLTALVWLHTYRQRRRGQTRVLE